jgi:hypothetical protein
MALGMLEDSVERLDGLKAYLLKHKGKTHG